MNKVVCLPQTLLPSVLDPNTYYFSLFSVPALPEVGYVASQLRAGVERAGLRPDVNTWDFTIFALSVSAADKAVSRQKSPNGWTREIYLQFAIHDLSLWQGMQAQLEAMLKFLTGDYWTLDFVRNNQPLPFARTRKAYNADCVALLSGGMDSLVGAIDLVDQHKKPLLVSHIVRGNEQIQQSFAETVSPHCGFCQWNEAIKLPKSTQGEGSTRGRSIVFFAFAALAATGLPISIRQPKKIYVAENGFISLNISLNSSRVSSLSTKTTHPVYMDCLRKIWQALGLNLSLETPYRFCTKGEMLRSCRNQTVLHQLLGNSVSCGKYGVHKLTHCGRCVPCMVRRAAFQAAGIQDTTRYVFSSLLNACRGRHPNDVGAMAMQCVRARRPDFLGKVLGEFAFASQDDRPAYIDVYKRGLSEVEQLLQVHSVL